MQKAKRKMPLPPIAQKQKISLPVRHMLGEEESYEQERHMVESQNKLPSQQPMGQQPKDPERDENFILEKAEKVVKKLNRGMNELILSYTFITDSDKVVINRRRFNIKICASTVDRQQAWDRFKEFRLLLDRQMAKE